MLERLIAVSLKIYEWLLFLYPETFRKEYGRELMQACRDSFREIETKSDVIGLWFLNFRDLIESAALERLRQFTGLRWLPEGTRLTSSIFAFVVSAGFFFWIIWAITVFLLVPWDVGNPPTGTFAEVVNNFFDLGDVYTAQSLAYIVIGLELFALLKIILQRKYKLGVILWRFTAIHVISSVTGVLVSALGMWIVSLMFPNWNAFEGDQSCGVAYVYWGLIVLGSIILFFGCQVFSTTPFKFMFRQNQALPRQSEP